MADARNSTAQFPVTADVPLHVDLADEADDQRRIAAEVWCRQFSEGRWLRRIDRRENIVRFEFERIEDAALFKIWHG